MNVRNMKKIINKIKNILNPPGLDSINSELNAVIIAEDKIPDDELPLYEGHPI